MRVEVGFQNERLDLEIPEECLVGAWHGPAGVDRSEVEGLVRAALDAPRGYPPLAQCVVPGDRIAIAWDARLPAAGPVLDAVCRTLQEGGGDGMSITVVVAGESLEDLAEGLPPGVTLVAHDPQRRPGLAYLATTQGGRRVYLNRHLTDADLVVPVGRIGYDPVLGYRGPWGVIFPGLSDLETLGAYRSMAGDDWPDAGRPSVALAESSEVSWLLGSQFHLGIVAGAEGPYRVVAGLDSEVRAQGVRELDDAWTFRAESQADLVVVGIGRAGEPTRIEGLADGLGAAARLVRHGGKIVALSRAAGPIGPALGRLGAAGDPRAGLVALRGHEDDADYLAARQVGRAAAWADVYLLSALDPQTVEDLSMIALDRPEEARRLVAGSRSTLVVSQADLTRPLVSERVAGGG